MKFQQNLLNKYLRSSEQPWKALVEIRLFLKVLSTLKNRFTGEIIRFYLATESPMVNPNNKDSQEQLPAYSYCCVLGSM